MKDTTTANTYSRSLLLLLLPLIITNLMFTQEIIPESASPDPDAPADDAESAIPDPDADALESIQCRMPWTSFLERFEKEFEPRDNVGSVPF